MANPIEEMPSHVVAALKNLDAELREGYITAKGYEKKKAKILSPFQRRATDNDFSSRLASPSKADLPFDKAQGHSSAANRKDPTVDTPGRPSSRVNKLKDNDNYTRNPNSHGDSSAADSRFAASKPRYPPGAKIETEFGRDATSKIITTPTTPGTPASGYPRGQDDGIQARHSKISGTPPKSISDIGPPDDSKQIRATKMDPKLSQRISTELGPGHQSNKNHHHRHTQSSRNSTQSQSKLKTSHSAPNNTPLSAAAIVAAAAAERRSYHGLEVEPKPQSKSEKIYSSNSSHEYKSGGHRKQHYKQKKEPTIPLNSSKKHRTEAMQSVLSNVPKEAMEFIQSERRLDGGRRPNQLLLNGPPSNAKKESSQLSNFQPGPGMNVSTKIKKLVDTLKRPKKNEILADFGDTDMEVQPLPVNPSAIKPEGQFMKPANGGSLKKLQSNQPDSPEDALYHYGNVLAKCPFMSTLDKNDKVVNTLTYGKLFTKCHKLAYNLVTKFKTRNGDDLNPGDRVALAFPSHQADSFAVGFFACLLANLVPIAIEPPDSKNEPGIAQKGFLLRQCSVSVVLTSESCLKSLPRDKDDSSVNISFKGWPIMNWLSIDHLQKPTKNWIPPNIDRQSPDIVSHIEYTVDKDGSVMGAIVSRACMLSHVRVLNSLCAYRSPTSSKEVETTICTIDYRRGVGLWHSIIMPLMNGMHIIQIPNTSPMGYHHPLEWLSVCSKFGAKYAITSARILQVAVLARQRDTVPLSINLSNLRMLLVADGQNPWSLAACDAFLDEFENSGLRAESLSTCAYSTETLTVSIRGPFSRAAVTGRGIMSLSALSDGAVRVENAGSLTSLTLQDLGPVIPTGSVAVLKIDGLPNLCRVDEIGEICLSGRTTGNGYFKLPGKSKHVFEVTPLNDRNQAITQQTYVRSGLLGFLGPSNVIFVCGNRNGLMTVSNRRHNTDDVIATILAVSPSSYVHLGRIAVFSTTVYYDERIIVVAEQKTDSTEDEGFQWMSRVMPCVDKIHDVNIYGFLLVPANTLPTSKDGFVDVYETKQRFFEGMLHPCCVLMCPHSCIPNMPIANKRARGRGGITSPIISEGRSLEILENETIYLAEYLRVRAAQSPDDVIFTLLSGKGTAIASVTCLQLHRKAEKIAILLEKSGLTAGQHAALIYPPGIDLIASFFACFYIGLIPVPIRPPHPQNVAFTLPTVKMVVDTSKSDVILSNHNIIKILRSKDAETVVPHRLWPSMVDTDAPVKGRLQEFYQSQSSHSTAYLDFGVTTNGILVGIKMSHEAAGSICHSHKIACELYPSRQVAICVDPYCGYGLVMWCLSSIYSGHHTILISPSDVELNPTLWLMAISQYKVRDTFVSYAVLDGCIKECSNSINTLSGKGINLSSLRSCVVVAEERPRTSLISVFTALFSSLGLSNRAVKTTFGCRTNPALCSQSLSSPDPSPLYVDLRALRNDRIKIVQKGSPYSICIIESGTILPGVKVCIVNPGTGVSCGLSELGEIWVSSKHNSEGYFCQADIDGDNPIPYNRRFRAKLNAGDDTQLTWARTGYLGFIHKTELIEADGAIHEAIHVVGSMDEALYWRDMRYYPSDIENTISRCHAAIGDCALFTWTNLLVVVVETKFDESVALDLVPLITNAVLNEHQVVVGVAVVVDPGTIPINSRGEKQRMHLRDRFLSDSLNPIYVAYNM